MSSDDLNGRPQHWKLPRDAQHKIASNERFQHKMVMLSETRPLAEYVYTILMITYFMRHEMAQFYAAAIFNAVKSADKRVSGARVVWAGKACFHKNKQTRYMKEP